MVAPFVAMSWARKSAGNGGTWAAAGAASRRAASIAQRARSMTIPMIDERRRRSSRQQDVPGAVSGVAGLFRFWLPGTSNDDEARWDRDLRRRRRRRVDQRGGATPGPSQVGGQRTAPGAGARAGRPAGAKDDPQ